MFSHVISTYSGLRTDAEPGEAGPSGPTCCTFELRG